MSGFIRFDFDGRLEEKAGQQFVSGRGMFNDGYTRIHRPEPHGFASSPPAGSKGLLLPSPGNPDFAVVLGLEHPSHRPSGLPSGGTAIYDASGNIISLVGTKIRLVAPTFEFVGNVEVQGNISATGSIIDAGGNTANHTH